jgi:hypothetical protein
MRIIFGYYVEGSLLCKPAAKRMPGLAQGVKGGNSSGENSPQTRHRAKQIEEK